MEKTRAITTSLLNSANCQILTDDSCCLNNEEQMKLGVEMIPFLATINQLEDPLRNLLSKKEFVLFVGTTPSLSIINDTVRDAVTTLDEKDKSLRASERIYIIDTSCFSGGLGFLVTYLAEFFNSGSHSLNDIRTYAQFLSNHIAHFFVEPSPKRWNDLIYVPRTGPVNYSGGRFRGNKAIYNYLGTNLNDNAYNPKEKVWVCYSELREEAKNLARHLKKHCPDSRIDMSHSINPHSVASLSDDVIACFYLSTEVRPDEPSETYDKTQYAAIDRKNKIAKYNITKMTRIAQAFHKNHFCPEF